MSAPIANTEIGVMGGLDRKVGINDSGIFATIGVMWQRFPVVADMTDVRCTYKILPLRHLFAL